MSRRVRVARDAAARRRPPARAARRRRLRRCTARACERQTERRTQGGFSPGDGTFSRVVACASSTASGRMCSSRSGSPADASRTRVEDVASRPRSTIAWSFSGPSANSAGIVPAARHARSAAAIPEVWCSKMGTRRGVRSSSPMRTMVWLRPPEVGTSPSIAGSSELCRLPGLATSIALSLISAHTGVSACPVRGCDG